MTNPIFFETQVQKDAAIVAYKSVPNFDQNVLNIMQSAVVNVFQTQVQKDAAIVAYKSVPNFDQNVLNELQSAVVTG